MKELDPLVLLDITQEMLGPWLWVLLGGAALWALAFIALLVRDKGCVMRRLCRAKLVGILGGILALALLLRLSSSSITDAAGAADWLVMAAVFILGLTASTLLVYTVAGWWPSRR